MSTMAMRHPEPDSGRPTDADFQAQLDDLAELQTTRDRRRWVVAASMEAHLLKMRERELMQRIDDWNGRFVPIA
jgi:hypothetical protein